MKGILFLEQLLEADHERLMKWKHFCAENEINFKGKIPKWFKLIENEVKEEGIGSRKLKEKYLNKNMDKRNIHMKIFDKDEKIAKNNLVAWKLGTI